MTGKSPASSLERTPKVMAFLAAVAAACSGDDGASLSSGNAGLAMLSEGLAAAGLGGQAELAEQLLDQAGHRLGEEPMSASLYSGFTGVAWAHNRRQRIEGRPPLPDDDCEAVDGVLADALSQASWRGHFDLINGLAGIAVYLLDRVACDVPRAALADVVRHLERAAVSDDCGLTWITPPRHLPAHFRALGPDGVADLGLAHGVPAPLAILAEIAAAGIERDRCLALLHGGMSWLLAHRLTDGFLSAFPSVVVPGEASKTYPARLAWCYGDAGVALALARVSALSGDASWSAAARETALRAAGRPLADAGVVDHSLCHGSASLYLAFDRLHRHFGDPELRAAATRWLGVLTSDLESEPPLHQYRMIGESGRVDSRGLLEGPAGAALAILDALGLAPAGWARWMMLDDIPGSGGVGHA
ncbi:MAG: lanthionine synthetase C family protein [bacterium]|nr:lanthionine synthetase C family protein [bacterium]